MLAKQIEKGLMVALILALVAITGSARADAPAATSIPANRSDEMGPQAISVTVAPLLQYQGRLTDPGTGDPVSDGVYEIGFRLYDVESGSTPLWQETKDVPVQGGIFSTALGDTTALDRALFNGQALWLGIKVRTDDEATPRMPFLPVAYAMSLVPGAVVDANSVDPAFQVNNAGSGEGLSVGGSATVTGDLSVGGSLAGGTHEHTGGDITSGVVLQARIDGLIARDSEIVPTVLANDGPGSTLNADLLDGQSSEDFAEDVHTHSGDDITSGTVPQARIDAVIARDSEIVPTVLANDGPGSTLNADLLDGQSSEDFAEAAHNHDARYFTEEESDTFFLHSTGPDAMSGSSTGALLDIDQNGGGVAIYANAAGNDGVVGETSTTGGGAGVKGVAGPTTYGTTVESGVFGDSADGFGVLAHSASYFAIYGRSETGAGVRGDGNGAAAAVSGYNYGTGYGGYFYGANNHALYAAGSARVTQDLTVNGETTTDRVVYSVPRTQYFVVGGEGFVPGSDVAYNNSYGMGGAYIHSGGGAMVAPVHLPHGAVVTGFKAFFNDSSTSDMSVTLYRLSLTSGGYTGLASVTSSGTSGYYSLTDTSISNATINNTLHGYLIYAYSSSWNSSLRIMGALVTYTIAEAP